MKKQKRFAFMAMLAIFGFETVSLGCDLITDDITNSVKPDPVIELTATSKADDTDDTENTDDDTLSPAEHISVKNVSNGIQVTLTMKSTDPSWNGSGVTFTENGQAIDCYYSYIQNGESIINASNNTYTFLYPFTTANSKYTFTINPYESCSETVEIVAENTSEVQLCNVSELVQNFKLVYEENDDADGEKRLVKVTKNPYENFIFTNQSALKSKQLCVNAYSYNSTTKKFTWVYNFGHNETQMNLLLNDGLDFIGNSNINSWKTADQFKKAFNQGDKIVFIPHLQFSTDSNSSERGGFVISLGSYTFDWTKIKIYTEISVYNPTSKTLKIYSAENNQATTGDLVYEIDALEGKKVKLDDSQYYFLADENGTKIPKFYFPNCNVYLYMNEPEEGKEYLALNQYKSADKLENYTRTSASGESYETYNICLFEIVEASAEDAYKYDENTYVRIYPSANYWIDSKSLASNLLGTKVTYNEDFRNNFEENNNTSWLAFGWSTYDNDLEDWYCHFVISDILHVKSEN